jgi:hypothetical protein
MCEEEGSSKEPVQQFILKGIHDNARAIFFLLIREDEKRSCADWCCDFDITVHTKAWSAFLKDQSKP